MDALLGIVEDVLDITRGVVLAAKDLVQAYAHLSARDAVHAAVMQAHGITRNGFRAILAFEVVQD